MKYWWLILIGNLCLANGSFNKNIYFYYDNNQVPCDWEKIANIDSVCNYGKNQSPINIDNTLLNSDDIEYFYSPLQIKDKVQIDGNALEFESYEDNYILINKQKYNLVQFHFHHSSEHTLHDIHYDMELHLVHKNKYDQLAVIGIFIKPGNSNHNIVQLIDFSLDSTQKFKKNINLNNLLPTKSKNYHYSGSLTTPPCTEGVKWFIFDQPVEASPKEIEILRSLTKFNSRSLQMRTASIKIQ